MSAYRDPRFRNTLWAAFPAVFFFGCAGGPDSSGSASKPPEPTPAAPPPVAAGTQTAPPTPVSTVIDARPAAVVNGRSVGWGELRPILNELAGATALREIILDRRIRAATEEAGVIVTGADLVRERKLMLENLHEEANLAVRLLEELRVRQGLGPHRFEALLRRNAALRQLVQGEVEVTSTIVRRRFELVYGPRRQARLMVVPTLREAQQAIDYVKAGALFGEVAVRFSTDASAARGGLLEPISRADPSYPEALRQALWTLLPGEVSAPVLLDNRYAVLMLVDEIPGEDVAFDDVRAELERGAKLDQERVLMDRRARALLTDVSVTIFDDSLKEAWQRSAGARLPSLVQETN